MRETKVSATDGLTFKSAVEIYDCRVFSFTRTCWPGAKNGRGFVPLADMANSKQKRSAAALRSDGIQSLLETAFQDFEWLSSNTDSQKPLRNTTISSKFQFVVVGQNGVRTT